MAAPKKTLATALVIVAAVVAYYATLSVPPNFSSSDGRTLRVIAFAMDLHTVLRGLPTNAHIHWFNFISRICAGFLKADDPSVRYTDMEIDDIGVKVRLYEPVDKRKGKPRAGMVYFHGGGFMYGDTRTHHVLTHHLAAELDVVLVSVDYRHSWQAPFPAAVDDSTEATVWFLRHAKDYNVDPNRIAIAGDSAGGSLAAVVSQRLTFEQGYSSLPKLKFQGLVYPGLQGLDFHTPSYQLNREKPCSVISREFVASCFCNYITTHTKFTEQILANNHTSPAAKAIIAKRMSHDLVPGEFKQNGYIPPSSDENTHGGDTQIHEKFVINPDHSPLIRDNLTGLPPAYMVTAGHDPLRDDGIMYVRRLEDAAVEVTWKHYENGVHGMFSLFIDTFSLESGKQSVEDFITYARHRLS